jgi:hypothetical protein
MKNRFKLLKEKNKTRKKNKKERVKECGKNE